MHPMQELATRRWWRRPSGLAVAVIVVGSFGLWAYALSGLAERTPPDTLTETAFAVAAEPRCAAARAAIDELPLAMTARSAVERAGTLDQATTIVEGLVIDLRAIPVDAPADRALVDAWLDDWDRYVADRRRYAEALRSDATARFTLTARNGKNYTRTMDAMAEVNEMPSCHTPGDVG
jgi:hypothetical protein